MKINIYVYINAIQLLKKSFKVKCGISKLALRETQTKAIYPSASYQQIKLKNKILSNLDIYIGNLIGVNPTLSGGGGTIA